MSVHRREFDGGGSVEFVDECASGPPVGAIVAERCLEAERCHWAVFFRGFDELTALVFPVEAGFVGSAGACSNSHQPYWGKVGQVDFVDTEGSVLGEGVVR